jgi:hypothetical protein
MTAILFRTDVYFGFTKQARNRLRKTKILNRLRSIQRWHPTLDFDVERGIDFIKVSFAQPRDLTMFNLLWPHDYPSWEQIDDISGHAPANTTLGTN